MKGFLRKSRSAEKKSEEVPFALMDFAKKVLSGIPTLTATHSSSMLSGRTQVVLVQVIENLRCGIFSFWRSYKSPIVFAQSPDDRQSYANHVVGPSDS